MIYDRKSGMIFYEHYIIYHRIFMTFRKNKFYLSRKKTKFFIDMINEEMNVFECHIQNDEISIMKSKMNIFITLQSSTSFQELDKDLRMYN